MARWGVEEDYGVVKLLGRLRNQSTQPQDAVVITAVRLRRSRVFRHPLRAELNAGSLGVLGHISDSRAVAVPALGGFGPPTAPMRRHTRNAHAETFRQTTGYSK